MKNFKTFALSKRISHFFLKGFRENLRSLLVACSKLGLILGPHGKHSAAVECHFFAVWPLEQLSASMLLLLVDCIFMNSANWSLAGTSGALGVWSFLSAVAAPKLLALHWSKTACGCTHKQEMQNA